MRRLAIVLMALGLFGAMPVFAAEHSMMMNTKEGMRECALKAETITEKIARLESEIAKGSKKYSPAEIKELSRKLGDVNKVLDDMQKP